MNAPIVGAFPSAYASSSDGGCLDSNSLGPGSGTRLGIPVSFEAPHRNPFVPLHAQAIDLVDDPTLIREYEAHHRAVWPEVVEGLRAIGIRRMRIWRTGCRLFMVFEAPEEFDPARDYQSYAEDPRCREWDELMREYQRRIPAATDEPGWWTPMTEIFDLEEQSA